MSISALIAAALSVAAPPGAPPEPDGFGHRAESSGLSDPFAGAASPALEPGLDGAAEAPVVESADPPAGAADPALRPTGEPSRARRATPSAGLAPLPPPPPPAPPQTLRSGAWRGSGWISGQLLVGGAVAGARPAKGAVVAVGGGFGGGWRAHPIVGVGLGFAAGPHALVPVVYRDLQGNRLTVRELLRWTALEADLRLFVPVRGRVEPRFDLAGGPLWIDRPARGVRAGWGARIGAGADVWVGRAVTLELGVEYRMFGASATLGHHLFGRMGLGVHF